MQTIIEPTATPESIAKGKEIEKEFFELCEKHGIDQWVFHASFNGLNGMTRINAGPSFLVNTIAREAAHLKDIVSEGLKMAASEEE